MKLIEEQQKYVAWKLSGQKIDDGRLTGVLSEAHVDLNPHQVQAAMFALQSPFSKGVILADEVGLGKTIEAGLVISQMWSEGKRNIIIVVPASLQKQWKMEMEEKFYIPSTILRTDSVADTTQGSQLYICSHNYAASHTMDLRRNDYNLVVIDEAHKLRNVYKSGQKQAKAIKDAFANSKKLLLTATPLQNSIQELFGLVSVIDEKVFGDIKSFNAKYGYNLVDNKDKFKDLRERIKPVIHRTLRRQVEDYIKYTKRIPMMMEYTPYPDERKLYTDLTEYLSRENTYGIPSAQRKLMLLVFRKVMASSTLAVAHTIKTVIDRLTLNVEQLERQVTYGTFESDIEDMFGDDIEDVLEENGYKSGNRDKFSAADIAPMRKEISELQTLYDFAHRIKKNKKGESLLKAIKTGFKKMEELGAEQKALVFTENKTTQQYLNDFLESNGYKGKIVLFNGDNDSSASKDIYQKWLESNSCEDDVTDTDINRRQALVDHFRDSASIMIATEAAAEGVNLQFCSLVINYDLPWNPQRIEQRIGRCHRYGQKHDVVVFNFLNKGNAADKRVYELLKEKFHLFDGVFGSSNEVLGAITSGTNIESKIVNIYQNCRTEDEINKAFDDLQTEMQADVEQEMAKTKNKLLESMSDETLDLLDIQKDSENRISEYNQMLWDLTTSYLGRNIQVRDADKHVFTLLRNPFPRGLQRKANYGLNSHNPGVHNYRIGDSLAQNIINTAKGKTLSSRDVTISGIEGVGVNEGYLALELVRYESSLHSDEKLILVAMDNAGNALQDDISEKLINASMTSYGETQIPDEIVAKEDSIRQQKQSVLTRAENNLLEQLSQSEIVKIDKWADDQLYLLDKAIHDAQEKRQEAKRNRDKAITDLEKQRYQSIMEDCDIPIMKARQAKNKRTPKVQEEAEKMKKEAMKRIKPHTSNQNLFFIHWKK